MATEPVGLVQAQERKLLEAIRMLTRARQDLHAVVADTVDSSRALRREARQARRHSHGLLDEIIRQTAVAERLVAEARAIHGERTGSA